MIKKPKMIKQIKQNQVLPLTILPKRKCARPGCGDGMVLDKGEIKCLLCGRMEGQK